MIIGADVQLGRLFDRDRTEKCFGCGTPLGAGVSHHVRWMGLDGQDIVFHPDCAFSFSLKFGRDLWELDILLRGAARNIKQAVES